MTPFASPRLASYLALSAIGLIAALAIRRPELVVVAAPFAFIVAAGLLLEGRPGVRVFLHLDHDRFVEGDEIEAEIEVDTSTPVDLLELHLVLPDGLAVVEGDNPYGLRLHADEERTLPLTLRCERWGSYELGDIRLRARGRIAMLVWEGRVRRAPPDPRLPAARAPPEPCRAARDPARDGRSRRADTRRRARVRGHAGHSFPATGCGP